MLTLALSMQLELHAHEQLDKAWRRLAKREAKAVQSNSAHTPAAKQPEAVFLPELLDEFLQVRLALEHVAFVGLPMVFTFDIHIPCVVSCNASLFAWRQILLQSCKTCST